MNHSSICEINEGRKLPVALLKSTERRGSALMLIVGLLIVFAITAAITVDYAYMQLVRTELRVATDAAAKAGAEALARTEDLEFARAEAVRYAGLNTVGGKPFKIKGTDISLGRLVEGNNGRWEFSAGGSPENAVRVHARTGGTASHPAVPLFFGRVLSKSDFSPQSQATAGQQQVEVCLCLDRSGSMLFDMSGTDWVYPPNNPKLSSFTAWGTMWQNHLSPPHPTESRWAVLAGAVQVFLDEAQLYNPPPRTSLVTWGSNYTMPIAPSTVFQAATLNAALPPFSNADYQAQRSVITNSINQLGSLPMMGATDLSAGLDLAVAHMTGPQASQLSNKIVILLTDGQWNNGRDPISAGAHARDAGVLVHAVSMLTNVQPDVRQMAEMTGGRYYLTQNEAELREAFRDLARSLQIVMID